MNQVKVSTLDLVPSPASVSEDRAAREGAATAKGENLRFQFQITNLFDRAVYVRFQQVINFLAR